MIFSNRLTHVVRTSDKFYGNPDGAREGNTHHVRIGATLPRSCGCSTSGPLSLTLVRTCHKLKTKNDRSCVRGGGQAMQSDEGDRARESALELIVEDALRSALPDESGLTTLVSPEVTNSVRLRPHWKLRPNSVRRSTWRMPPRLVMGCASGAPDRGRGDEGYEHGLAWCAADRARSYGGRAR